MRLFDDNGLRAMEATRALLDAGPVMTDAQGGPWVYAGGVWRPDPIEVQRRIVHLLKERYRPSHARTIREVLPAVVGRFDIAPTTPLINMVNGMVRWQSDPDPELLEHHPEFLSSVQLPVPWEPTAACPRFDAFLSDSLPEDDHNRAWQVIGYFMMAGNPLQRLFMLTGSGGNGKGVYLDVLRALLGEDNVSAVPLQEFSDSRFATAELVGKLANVCGDIDATFITNTGRIKELSGGDKMKGERKNEHPFYFKFWGKAIFSANAIPGAADSSRGWLRRWEVVQFPYEPTKPDPGLAARIIAEELPGIAVKAIMALRQLMAYGEFGRGLSADTAHAEFAEKANRVIRWINDPDSNVIRDADTFNKGTILVRAFRQWEAEDQGNGHREIGVQRFHELARQAGLLATVKRGNRGYYGLHVRDGVMVHPKDQPWMNVTRERVHLDPAPPPEPEQATLV